MLKAFSIKNLLSHKSTKFLFKKIMNDSSSQVIVEDVNNSDDAQVANKKIKLDQEQVVDNLNELENTTADESNKKSGIKKRKYALLIGYCGEGYFGLQR